jgi:hypothetical protein
MRTLCEEYEGVSKSFRTGHLERELQMVQLSTIQCSCIAILWVSLVSFAAVTLYVASQQVFIFVSVHFVIDSVRKLLDIPTYFIFSTSLHCRQMRDLRFWWLWRFKTWFFWFVTPCINVVDVYSCVWSYMIFHNLMLSAISSDNFGCLHNKVTTLGTCEKWYRKPASITDDVSMNWD